MTVEAWCRAYIASTELEYKLAPPAPPRGDVDEHWANAARPERFAAPGRPSELRVVARGDKAPSAKALVNTAARVKLLLTFAHHELQAAELFCWAVLAFPDTPRAFRRGLVRLALEELEHLALYRAHLEALGGRIGDQPVRDWFWQRVGGCATPAAFCAFVGLGLEGGNLEHSARFARAFRAAGDEHGATILERVEHDEIGHVAFGKTWFEHFTGAPLTFDAWTRHLPHPISPALLRGTPLNVDARRRAGLDAEFIERLANAPGVELPRVEVPRAQPSRSTGAEEPSS